MEFSSINKTFVFFMDFKVVLLMDLTISYFPMGFVCVSSIRMEFQMVGLLEWDVEERQGGFQESFTVMELERVLDIIGDRKMRLLLFLNIRKVKFFKLTLFKVKCQLIPTTSIYSALSNLCRLISSFCLQIFLVC